MPVALRTISIQIPAGSGRKSIQGVAVFNSDVLDAVTSLNGFAFRYDDNIGRNVLVNEMDTDVVQISATDVTFRIECNVADESANDSYSGYVTATITAVVV